MLLHSHEPGLATFRVLDNHHRLRTAVIDDSETFLEVVCALLECDDSLDVVARGHDGEEAINIVAKLRPDLVVMDIDMPRLDGLNAALVISTRFPSTQIVLMSAEDSRELRADCLWRSSFRAQVSLSAGFSLLFASLRLLVVIAASTAGM